MSASVAVPRSFLVYVVCLPLAVLIGYLLAEPMDSGSIAVVGLVLAVLSVPVLLRWHHPLLVLSYTGMGCLIFLPGKPQLWMLMAGVSFGIAILNRAIGRPVAFFNAPSVACSLIGLALVVLVTARLTGGVGLQAFGASLVGGRRYISILAAIMFYFALATNRINPDKAGLFLGLFWLSGLLVVFGYLGAMVPGLDFLLNIFPAEGELMGDRAFGNSVFGTMDPMFRLGSLIPASTGVIYFLLARYGIRGVITFQRPWRLLAFCAAFVASLATGFRGTLLTFILTLAAIAYWEGLFQPRYLLPTLGGIIVAAALILPFTSKLPLAMQRTISFLPVKVDPIVRNSADASTEWRIQMWREVLPLVPKYLLKGKGYAINPDEMYGAMLSSWSGASVNAESSIIAGDYHSGPLSVVMPFGIYGVVAFVWFLVASVRVLHRNYLYGNPALKTINTFLLAFFLVRIFNFVVIFGGFYSDMIGFCGLIGFSVCLNGVAKPPVRELSEPAGEYELLPDESETALP